MKSPSFDGTPVNLLGYEEDVLQGLTAVAGPLTRVAKVLVRSKALRAQWLSHARGAYAQTTATWRWSEDSQGSRFRGCWAPDDAGRLFKDETQVPLCPSLLSNGRFEEGEKLRTEEPSKRRIERTAQKAGRFLGPVRVLATGELRPGHVATPTRKGIPIRKAA